MFEEKRESERLRPCVAAACTARRPLATLQALPLEATAFGAAPLALALRWLVNLWRPLPAGGLLLVFPWLVLGFIIPR